MTTELFEVYTLEEGDVVIIADNFYTVVDIGGDSSVYTLRLADEEGNPKRVDCEGSDLIRVLCDSDHEE